MAATVDEPAEMVRRTLLAARSMEDAHQPWLLDAGNRTERRRLGAALHPGHEMADVFSLKLPMVYVAAGGLT